jgi:hypothetical protein
MPLSAPLPVAWRSPQRDGVTADRTGPDPEPTEDRRRPDTANRDLVPAAGTREDPDRNPVGVFPHCGRWTAQYQLLFCQNAQAPHGLP